MIEPSGAVRDRGHTTAEVTQPPPRFSWRPVATVAVATVVILLAFAGRYDYFGDELYFRMLSHHPAWGYLDQPPMTPMLARLSVLVFSDTVWATRVPSALLVGALAVVLALIAREAGGTAGAQLLASLGVTSSYVVVAGHALLTNAPDLVIWALIVLLVLRALLRDRPGPWLAAGAVAGVGLYNKHLVVLLLIGLAVGLLLAGAPAGRSRPQAPGGREIGALLGRRRPQTRGGRGIGTLLGRRRAPNSSDGRATPTAPGEARRVLASPWPWAAAALALVVGLPNLVYQVTNGMPQVGMARAISDATGDDARVDFVPMQLLMIGPTLAPIWIAGIVALLRRPRLRAARPLAVAYLAMCVLILAVRGQPQYPIGMLLALYAVGCAPVARWFGRHRGRIALVTAAVAANIALTVPFALPVLPVRVVAKTPIPAINVVFRGQVSWPIYLRQIAEGYRRIPAGERESAVVIADTYSLAGAIDRYGPRYHLPTVYSGHNQLYVLRRPPESATVALLVHSFDDEDLTPVFDACETVGYLHNGLGIAAAEEGTPIRICRGPRRAWRQLWPRFSHLD